MKGPNPNNIWELNMLYSYFPEDKLWILEQNNHTYDLIFFKLVFHIPKGGTSCFRGGWDTVPRPSPRNMETKPPDSCGESKNTHILRWRMCFILRWNNSVISVMGSETHSVMHLRKYLRRQYKDISNNNK